jgi:hypothetical protein
METVLMTPAKPRGRARLTSHADLLPDIKDDRSAPARRFRDLVRAFIVDQGEPGHCSEIWLGLRRRLAAATVQAELLEARMVNGEDVDIGVLCTLASTTVRLSQRLGLERVAKDIGPSLVDILKGQGQTLTKDLG